LRAARNPPATSVLARAYCRLQDLGNARAALRRLPRSYRAAVVRACTEAGLNLR
jgi:hypothetical protein